MRESPRSAEATFTGARHRERVPSEHCGKYGNFALAYSATFQPVRIISGKKKDFSLTSRWAAPPSFFPIPSRRSVAARDLIRNFRGREKDVCFWQASRPVAKILEKIGFCVNEMGTETRIELDGYDFDGPRKRNFRRALNRAACCSYTIAERSVTSLDREELQTVSERWRQTRGVKNREMTFLTRPAILDDEVDVRKFFTFDHKGSLQAFAFFDPIYEGGEVVGYLCSAKRRLPEADTLVGYAILHRSHSDFSRRGKSNSFPRTLTAMRHRG